MLRKVLPLALVCAFVSVSLEARAAGAEDAPRTKDLKRAEAVLEKLRRLEEAALTRGEGALREAASKLYPGLFSSVSELGDSDLKTDLSTAVALYDSAARGEGGAAPDCARELRDSYSRLCREVVASRGATRALLLAARARLHARMAEAALRFARGERDAATLETVSLTRAERATDISLAEEAVRALKELSDAGDATAPNNLGADAEGLDAAAGRLEEVGRLLASLPRGRLHTLLRNARDASSDALYWRLKSPSAGALVVNVNSYSAPDRLRAIDTRAAEAERAARDNRAAARRFIRRAEEALEAVRRGR